MRNDFKVKMERDNLPDFLIETFLSQYDQLVSGEQGFIDDEHLSPFDIGELPSLPGLEKYRQRGVEALSSCAVIKLNGGLGTSMGLDGPKCLITVKEGLSFFDITARSVASANRQFGCTIPFILMNSFNTEKETAAALARYPELKGELPATFIQNKYPKISTADFSPATSTSSPDNEWNPPGHGDIYTALYTSGILEKLLAKGIRYAFVSNIDNLGATLNAPLLGYMVENRVPFMMEVVKRTEMDKKGGHLAKLKKNGRLILREAAQCKADNRPLFEDITRYSCFNSNNIWLDLEAVDKATGHGRKPLDLPLIINRKTVDPADKTSAPVVQLETAMGSAVSLFEGAQAVLIDNTRFRPVKKWDDLALLRSDRFILNSENILVANPERTLPETVLVLDPQVYNTPEKFEERFKEGVPSLIECESAVIAGDFLFEKGCSFKGVCTLENRTGSMVKIPAGTVLTGTVVYE